ncbi:MAG: sulfur carrier protein ThiS [Phycisphaerales bacterium]|nr:sulfur carrier protein ThiS [Planctomycetota bacterium]MCH8507586.1 sulfur carrier protein ThiS [Phycisphaerales bacterium]
MECIINGQPMELPEDTTVAQLIERLGLSDAICAAEVEKELVPKRERATRVLRAGERVEVVTLVGGG